MRSLREYIATTSLGRYFGMRTQMEELEDDVRRILDAGVRVREMHREGRRQADIAFPGGFIG